MVIQPPDAHISTRFTGSYPCRNTTAGSIRAARRAGGHAAAPATSARTATDSPNVIGSCAGVLKRSVSIRRAAQKLAPR